MTHSKLLALLAIWLVGALPSSARTEQPAPAAPSSPTPGAAARSLTLAEAYRLAKEDNPTLQLMETRVQQAAADKRRAWAELHPSATISGTYSYNHPEVSFDPTDLAPPGTVDTDPIVIQKKTQLGFDIEAELPLFRGPAYHRVGIAKKRMQAAELRRIRTRRDYLLRVANAYYQALGLEEAVSALEEKVAVDRQNHENTRLRQEAGRALRSDVMRAELVLVQDEQSLRRQRNAFEAAKRRIGILIGLKHPIEVTRPPDPPSPIPKEGGLVDAALQRRSDVAALAIEIAAAEQGKTAAWWSFLPTLDLGFLYRWQEVSGFIDRKDSYALVGTLGFPLYLGGARYADLDTAAAQIAETRAAKAELTRDIAETIVALRAELVSAEAGFISAGKAVTLAEVTAEEMAARYEAGTATQLDLLDANQRQLEARIDLTRSRYTRDLARLSLTHALGQFDP